MKSHVRTAVEQALARQQSTSEIMAALHVAYDDVITVRQDMAIAAAEEWAGRTVTPGQAALIEAMRIEQAKIYGRMCPEYRRPAAERFTTDDEAPIDLEAARQRRGAA